MQYKILLPATPPPELKLCINAASASAAPLPENLDVLNMKRLGLAIIMLLLLISAVEADDAETQYWTCGYRGLCRRFCYAQEYIVGHHGCPRRYRCCAVRM
ncbi:hypothetical protein AGOR_G00028010 [Albula goreensis]|uniref:Beta-defensin n=1 Tax=Albula goreensis TaxID=1534307 RepID=A0A8T3E783_9TELE|nr:hypothetical protein AGOR_G00028010 [Albula goreensis]